MTDSVILCGALHSLTSAACAPLQDRWAAASGFDDTPVDPDVAREVVMLCCAIKPLCAWNGQARPRNLLSRVQGRVARAWLCCLLAALPLEQPIALLQVR